MPLNTQIKRNDRVVKVRWGGFHVAAMFLAAAIEDSEGLQKDFRPNDDLDYPAEPQPISNNDQFQIINYAVLGTVDWPHTCKQDHAFLDSSNGEVFRLKKDDVLSMWRS